MGRLDRRDGGRISAGERALLVTEDGREIACTIIDISRNGASVELVEDDYLPKTFLMRSLSSPLLAEMALVWRKDRRCGLSVVGGSDGWRLQSAMDNA